MVVLPEGLRGYLNGEKQRANVELDPGQVRVKALLVDEEWYQVEAIRKRSQDLAKRRGERRRKEKATYVVAR